MGLLSLLFGGAPAASAATPSQHRWVTGPDGYVMQAPQPPQAPPAPGSLVQQTAAQSPATPLAQSAVNPPAPTSDPNTPINVTAQNPDTWKPHHAGILGQIADYLLDTHFGKENTRRNMEGALEHLNSNPMEAVRRMAKFDPEGAQALWDKVTDNQRMQGTLDRQNKVLDNTIEGQLLTRAGNMAAVATPDNWSTMRDQIIAMGEHRGVDLAGYLPEQYDEGTADLLAAGVMPVAKRAAIAEQTRNHDVMHGDRAASLAERDRFHKGLLGQGAARIGISQGNLDERQEHDDVIEGQGQERLNQNGPGIPTMTKYGPGMISPDGNTLTINNPTHGSLLYIKDGKSWRLAKTKPTSGHDITVNH